MDRSFSFDGARHRLRHGLARIHAKHAVETGAAVDPLLKLMDNPIEKPDHAQQGDIVPFVEFQNSQSVLQERLKEVARRVGNIESQRQASVEIEMLSAVFLLMEYGMTAPMPIAFDVLLPPHSMPSGSAANIERWLSHTPHMKIVQEFRKELLNRTAESLGLPFDFENTDEASGNDLRFAIECHKQPAEWMRHKGQVFQPPVAAFDRRCRWRALYHGVYEYALQWHFIFVDGHSYGPHYKLHPRVS